jgi:hypothetical protein
MMSGAGGLVLRQSKFANVRAFSIVVLHFFRREKVLSQVNSDHA